MNSLRIEELFIRGAGLGAEAPLPPLANFRGANAPMKISPSIPDEDRKYFGYGTIRSILPYSTQNNYDRIRTLRKFRSIVLENEILKATFLPEIGGRLWSLYHKPQKRELLYVNPVFQPANLALRNAWVSGGVEWNMSFCGHHPFTCEPLHTARLGDANGDSILRMYEWERLRGLLFQLDFSLPSGSPVLLVRVRLVNTNPDEIPTYWWSNIAVPEAAGNRVLVPSDWAMGFGYGGELGRIDVPVNADGVDCSYPTNIPSSNDFFFRISDGVRPWIASLDEGGRGLFQTSTSRLRGRKLFVWGMSPGGRRWQEFLSEPGHPYVEIQAGLGRTQAECVPMPGHADWSWMEAYGLLEAEAELVHGDDWELATGHVGQEIAGIISSNDLEARLEETARLADSAPEELLFSGSGWGALEDLRRSRQGLPSLSTPATPFPAASMGARQQPWRSLLETGRFGAPQSPVTEPSWIVQREWRELLEKAVENEPEHAEIWLQLGVMYYSEGWIAKARLAWQRSISLLPTAVALRNLSLIEAGEGRSSERLRLIRQALDLSPTQQDLIVECLEAFLEEGQPGQVIEICRTLSEDICNGGRVRLIMGKAWLQLNMLDKVRLLFEQDWDIADLKEGDNSLTDLWIQSCQRQSEADGVMQSELEQYAVPGRFDFRMKAPQSHEMACGSC